MEKQKLNINFWWLLLGVIIITVINVTISIIICNQMNQSNEKERLDNEQQVTMPIDNNVIPTQNVSENTDTLKLTMPVTLNNNKHTLVIESILGEIKEKIPHDEYKLYEQIVKISIDGKEYPDIEKGSVAEDIKNKPAFSEMPEVKIMSGADGEDYIVVSIMRHTSSGFSDSVIHILDENGNNIGKINDYGRTIFHIGKTDLTIPAHKIDGFENKGAIEVIKPTKEHGAEMHRYTIKNGEIKDEIVRTYTSDEVTGAGVKYDLD